MFDKEILYLVNEHNYCWDSQFYYMVCFYLLPSPHSQVSLSQTFAIPGDSGFCLGGFFSNPAARSEADQFRAYFLQLRTEAGMRFIEHIYNADETPNKFWFQFSKRKFMNIDRT